MSESMEQVGEQVRERAHQAREQAGNVAEEWRVQMSERSVAMRDRGVARLRSLATELRQMAAAPTGSSSTAHDFARMAATRIDMVCAELESRDPGDFIVEARQYARAHPTQVLIGMFAVGAVAGRLMRGASITRRPEALIDVRDTRMSSIPDPGYIA